MAPNKADKPKLAPTGGELSLDDMLKISRQKKDNENFAQRIFGKDRRSSAPGAFGKRSKTADGLPTLASRIGVQKRNTKSSTNLKRDAAQKARSFGNPSRPSPLNHSQSSGPGSLSARIGSRSQPAVPPAAPAPPRQNFSIRGVAGPVTVMASNFAPGTTAADIRSAFEPVGGEMLSCRLKTANPTVIAEMIFSDRAGADAVIETFNNQKADGRLLYVYLQATGGAITAPTGPARSGGRSWQHEAAAAKLENNRGAARWTDDSTRSSGYGAEPEVQDGRYGFGGADQDAEMEVELDQPAPANNSDDRYNGSSRRDDRGNGYRSSYQNGSDSYREDRRGDERRERGGRQDQGLYSDRYARNGGNQSSGRGWRSTTLYL